MSVFEFIQWPYAVSGVLVGGLVGLTGVGGGSLMTPFLVLFFGINPATAVGTDLLFACATKSTGVAMHGWRGSVEWRIVWRFAAGSVPATALTIYLIASHGKTTSAHGGVIATTLGFALILQQPASSSGIKSLSGSRQSWSA